MFCFLWLNAFYYLKFIGPHESGNCTILVHTKQHVFLLLDALCYANVAGLWPLQQANFMMDAVRRRRMASPNPRSACLSRCPRAVARQAAVEHTPSINRTLRKQCRRRDPERASPSSPGQVLADAKAHAGTLGPEHQSCPRGSQAPLQDSVPPQPSWLAGFSHLFMPSVTS